MSSPALIASIRVSLGAYVERELMFQRGDLRLDAELDLLAEGILDSLGMLRLIAFLEDSFAVKLEPDELSSHNFRNLERIAALVASKQTAPSSADVS